MSTKIILTGASGFIGQHVLRRLRLQSADVLTIGARGLVTTDTNKLMAISENGTSQNILDYTNCTLVHLAWCMPDRRDFSLHASQVHLLSNLLRVGARSIGKIVAMGSAEEYGETSGRLTEGDAVNQRLSAYGWGKRAGQMLVESWCSANNKSGFWLRPFTVYGEGQQGDMAIPYAMRQALSKQPAIFSAGTQRRDFVHVDDVARAIILASFCPLSGFREINIGTGIATPLREVLEQFSRLLGAAGLFQYGARPMRPGEPEMQAAATDRAEKLLGFTTEIALDEGLSRMISEH